MSGPGFGTVAELLSTQEAQRPDATALVIDDERCSYRELASAVRRAAGYLRDELGLRRGEHAAMLMSNSVDAAVWLLAAATVGCAVVPLNTRLTGTELAYQIRHSDSAVVITSGQRHVEVLAEALLRDGKLSAEFTRLRRVVVLGDPAPEWTTRCDFDSTVDCSSAEPGPGPDDVLIIQYTSGTTAFPKGVLLEHRQVLTNAQGVAGRLGLTERDRVCSPSPFFHCAGTTLLLFLGLCVGATVYSFGAFDAGRVIETIEREQITVYNGVETFFIGLQKHPGFSPARLASIRTGWIAASEELVAQVHEQMGLTGIVNVYGISEVAPNVSIPSPADPPEVRRSCGRPHSGTRVRIVDDRAGAPVAVGGSGIIEVHGPCVTRGYYNAPEQTAEAIGPDGWLHTGDRGHLDEDGNLHYEGRAKDMLRVGGENVAPAEIEAALLAHPAIAEAAVVALAHPKMVEIPVAFVAPHQGSTVSPEELTEFAAGRLAPFKVPREVHVLEQLPTTGSGKVQKYLLANMVSERAEARPGRRL